jgi:hypothetical protein
VPSVTITAPTGTGDATTNAPGVATDVAADGKTKTATDTGAGAGTGTPTADTSGNTASTGTGSLNLPTRDDVVGSNDSTTPDKQAVAPVDKPKRHKRDKTVTPKPAPAPAPSVTPVPQK